MEYLHIVIMAVGLYCDLESFPDTSRGVVMWERVPKPFCTSNVNWRCGIQTITLKHDCDRTDVLATRRFALLVKSLQWKRKIQCGNSCRRMLTLLELFGTVFLFISCGNGVSTPLCLALHTRIWVNCKLIIGWHHNSEPGYCAGCHIGKKMVTSRIKSINRNWAADFRISRNLWFLERNSRTPVDLRRPVATEAFSGNGPQVFFMPLQILLCSEKFVLNIQKQTAWPPEDVFCSHKP